MSAKSWLLICCLLISGCAAKQPPPTVIQVKPVPRAKIDLPKLEPLTLLPTEWVVITPETYQTQIEKNEESTFFALDETNFRNLNLNLTLIRIYLAKQQALYDALKKYYEEESNLSSEVIIEQPKPEENKPFQFPFLIK